MIPCLYLYQREFREIVKLAAGRMFLKWDTKDFTEEEILKAHQMCFHSLRENGLSRAQLSISVF